MDRATMQRILQNAVDAAMSGAELYDDPGKELLKKTHAFMAQHDEQNFARALNTVARANPELHRQYLNSS